MRLTKVGPVTFWVGDLSASVLSRLIAWFGNESIADSRHLTMTQQFCTKIHIFRGAVVLLLIIQLLPSVGERNYGLGKWRPLLNFEFAFR